MAKHATGQCFAWEHVEQFSPDLVIKPTADQCAKCSPLPRAEAEASFREENRFRGENRFVRL